MELKATAMGKRLAQHPYDQVRMLPAGVEVSGDRHQYIIPFNQLLGVECKRGVVWGELEFQLPQQQVVRLHGTDWQETRRFHEHLLNAWQQWTQQMVEVSLQVLTSLEQQIQAALTGDHWLKIESLHQLQQEIEQQLHSLPLAPERLKTLPDCQPGYDYCLSWLNQAPQQLAERNQQWVDKLIEQHRDFFDTIESSPLNHAQCRAVVNGEPSILVLAGAGSGKTSVLVARVAWLIRQQLAQPQQILLLAFGRDAASELKQRISERTGQQASQVKTFHSLALQIILEATKKQPKITELETDNARCRQWLIERWVEQCSQKKPAAKGWRQWLTEELHWQLAEEEFWLDRQLQQRLAGRLQRWVALLRDHGGSQAELLAASAEDQRPLLAKRLKLLNPIVKAWKRHLKQEAAVDFNGLIQQACTLLEKGRFISPWKHLLVDEFQDISPQRAKLLKLLREANRHSQLFTVGDDWQAIYRFAGAELSLTTAFHHYFGEGATCYLDTTYRFNQRIGEVANRFVQQNPDQLPKQLNSLTPGNSQSVRLLPESQLEALINKMSGYVAADEEVLILARYHHLRPDLLDRAATRWPNLKLKFMTMHASKGSQADYVIVLGLNSSSEGFPAQVADSQLERALLPEREAYPDAEERRLAYVAMTRAKTALWLLFDPQQPSPFIEEFKQLGAKLARKP